VILETGGVRGDERRLDACDLEVVHVSCPFSAPQDVSVPRQTKSTSNSDQASRSFRPHLLLQSLGGEKEANFVFSGDSARSLLLWWPEMEEDWGIVVRLYIG
jgi:hypothetical protein